MKQLKIQGKETDDFKKENFHEVDDHFKLEKLVEVSNIRGDASLVSLDGKENDIVDIIMDDGTEWIGPLGDIKEIYNTESYSNRSSLDQDVLPTSLVNDQERGVKEWAIKLVGLFKADKPLDEEIAHKIGEKFDEKVMKNPGIFKLDKKFILHKKKINKTKNPILLFIHGTASDTDGSFKKLFDEDKADLWDKMLELYQDGIYGLQHKTVSVSPIQNAIDLLENAPKGSTFDIISHSRGGIVADILSRCDKRNSVMGFDRHEIKRIGKESNEEKLLFVKLNELAKEKKIVIRKVVRVACPAAGTILLSERLDHYLNGLLNAVKFALSGPVGTIYNALKNFLMEVIESRLTPDVLPGLLPMVPDSTFQDILNTQKNEVKGELLVVEGNSEVGWNIGHSLFVILSNLFYWEANDFVVNTSSMIYGARREGGVSFMRSEDDKTSHFNYFKNKNTQEAIKNAIDAKVGARVNGFTYLDSQDSQRGPVLELFAKMGEVVEPKPMLNRESVILLPGIMGSNLYVNDKKIWVDYSNIIEGDIAYELHKDASVSAETIIARFYGEFVEYLYQNYDVYLCPYDWRLSVDKAAIELKDKIKKIKKVNNKPLKVIAHSMGGLVVRSLMMQEEAFWKKFVSEEGSKLIMLGTPWFGSHLIMEVITGHSRRVKQLARLDFHHSKRELMEIFTTYDGIYQLLPTKGDNFEDQEFWKNLDDDLGKDEFVIPGKDYLNRFEKYKDQILSFKYDFTNTYYIAGKADGTTNSFGIKSSIFGKRLRYYKTSEGDGSVSWELGIPEGLSGDNIYYCDTVHGDLANEEAIYPAIVDILNDGKTDKLDKSPIISRGDAISASFSNDVLSNDPVEALEIIFGGELMSKKPQKKIEKLFVKVSHGDLKYADAPVMVGHFEYDGIMNAEGALDWFLGGKLSERHRVGNYPGKIGESDIIIDTNNQPKGAIIAGLGDPTDLTTFRLIKSVQTSIIKYLMTIRDNCADAEKEKLSENVTSLIIGSGYGQIPVEDALKAIIEGITRANKVITDLNPNYSTIKKVEFIELYEHRANQAYHILRSVEREENKSFKIKVDKHLTSKLGRRKKIEYKKESNWWYNLTTELKIEKRNGQTIPKLRFQLARGIARVEDAFTFTPENVTKALLEEFSRKQTWNEEIAKALFELIFPIDFKDIIRNQNNILWKMDISTASYPWEMFHDPAQDVDPTFVKAGLIRQLITPIYRKDPEVIRSDTALVVGDPIYENMELAQLPGARREARSVLQILKKNGFKVEDEIGKKGLDVLKAITNKEYKVLHISGHGVFNPDANEVGVVLGNNMYLTPSMVGNLSKVPEMVFVNCCHSGEIAPNQEKYYSDRYKLAANIGTELIKMGVQAVIVAGWAVNDSAAELFANVLYKRLLSGYSFGDAVRIARKSCYDDYSKYSTWGAYQCYGDQWYSLVSQGGRSNGIKEYISESEVVVDLENVWVDSLNKSNKDEKILKKMDVILAKAKEANLITGPVIEMEARIYREINRIDEAVEKFEVLLNLDKADFRVRSLEQYCNLIAKQLVKNGIHDSERLKEVELRLESLTLIGKTTMRLNLLGSGYKRIAQMATRIRDRNSYLNKMEIAYYQAYLIIQEKTEKSIYPLTNFLTARALREEYEDVVIENKKIEVNNILEQMKSRLAGKVGKYTDFWDEIYLINLLMCELLFEKNENKIFSLKNTIIEHYTKSFNIAGSLRHLSTEKEHLDFIVAVWDSKRDNLIKKKIQALKGINEFLESLMEKE